jgi:beta-xylosidase
MKFNDINLRDPFILPVDGKYYMYGTRGSTTFGYATGFDVFVSEDLETWSEGHSVFEASPAFWADRNFWAPEVHAYRGKYYMFASFKAENACRGTQILSADTPMGPFVPLTDGPVTPRNWECLDGTLYVSPDGKPYMIFCHEWTQVKDGEMCAMELTPDLKAAAGEPRLLFRASEPHWSNKGQEAFVTDGPFLYRMQDGRLLMLWSSFSGTDYVEAIAVSDNGDITGNWTHLPELLFEKNGGHGMIFCTFAGELRFIMHAPNHPAGAERPHLVALKEEKGTLRVV